LRLNKEVKQWLTIEETTTTEEEEKKFALFARISQQLSITKISIS
jgi:hypothetical protein